MKIIGGDFNAELGPGEGLELSAVGHYTLSKGNCRGEWMTQWLLQNKLVALNTMYKKIPQKQVTYCTSKDVGKQLDYIVTDRKHYKWSRDAEASDTIHMGSDHRCVMARFEIPKEKEKGKPRMTKAPVIEQQSEKSDDEKQQKYLELEQRVKEAEPGKTQRERLMKKTRQVWQQRTKRQKRKKTKGRQKQTRRQHQRQRQQLTKEPSKDAQQHWKEMQHRKRKEETKNMKEFGPSYKKERQSRKTKKIESVKSARRSKKCIRDNKRLKRQEKCKNILEKVKGTKNITSIKSVKKRILIPRVKNKEGEVVKTRQGIANVFGEVLRRLV